LLNKHKETVPLAELIEAMHIGKTELISFKIAVNEAAKIYGFSVSSAAFHVINNMRDYNRIGALKKELYELQLQKFAINQFCSRQSQALITLAKLQNHGITQDQIIHVKNFLENNGYNIDMKSTAASFK
jgi:predicted ATPase